MAYAATLAIDLDTGSYDNKEITLTGDVTNVVLTATRQTDYELRFKQDGIGMRRVFVTSQDIRPLVSMLTLDPRADEVTVWRLKYDGTNFNWG